MARIVVIGAGMGALAAAARLAVAGHRVTVCERSGTHGGSAGVFRRDGFAFDTGPGLLNLPAVYRDLFIKTGKKTLEQSVGLREVDPAVLHLFADGTRVLLPNASRGGVGRALDGAFGAGAGEAWNEMVDRGRGVWESTRRPLLEEPLGPGAQAREALARDPYMPAPARGLAGRLGLVRAPRTLAEVASRELRRPGLVALLEEYALRYGTDPRRAPAGAVVLPYMEQTFGTWYVDGGMRALADAVRARCEERSVEFRLGAEVVRVLDGGGRAAGVELADGTRLEADAVVCGVPCGPLLPDGYAPDGDAPAPAEDATGPRLGRLTVLLALDGARPPGTVHRTIVHAADREAELAALEGGGPDAVCERPTVTVLRPDDPALCPGGGRSTAVLSVAVPAHGTTRGAVDWTADGLAESCADRVLAAVGAVDPELADRVLWHEVRTPADTERETGAPGGALRAPSLAGAGGAFLAPGNTGPLPGLYLVGGAAHPGGGLPHSGMSGALVAELVGRDRQAAAGRQGARQ
ncbi:NAD(P)/FAD-dependent oxidoreductase [Streptomyces thermolineatus]|uniref:NAD(P)/FAD-dependent oxidoreductase n=1 Tax=Streptomyces thermolineatus TaxID=44033 RepID=A0ABP5ZYJ9_9ACTN